VTSRDRVGRVEHSTRILRPSHPIELGNLPDPRVRVGRGNPTRRSHYERKAKQFITIERL